MNLCSQVYATVNLNKKKNMISSSTEPEESSSTYVNVKHLEGATKKDDTVVSAIHRNDVQYSTIPGTRNTLVSMCFHERTCYFHGHAAFHLKGGAHGKLPPPKVNFSS